MSLCGLLKRSTFRKYRPNRPKKIRNCDHCTGSRRKQPPVFDQQQLDRPRKSGKQDTTRCDRRMRSSPCGAACAGRRNWHSSRETSAWPPTPSAREKTGHSKPTAPDTARFAQSARSATPSATTSVGCRAASSRPFVSHVLGSHSCCVKRKRYKRFLKPLVAEQPRLRAAHRSPHERQPWRRSAPTASSRQ